MRFHICALSACRKYSPLWQANLTINKHYFGLALRPRDRFANAHLAPDGSVEQGKSSWFDHRKL